MIILTSLWKKVFGFSLLFHHCTKYTHKETNFQPKQWRNNIKDRYISINIPIYLVRNIFIVTQKHFWRTKLYYRKEFTFWTFKRFLNEKMKPISLYYLIFTFWNSKLRYLRRSTLNRSKVTKIQDPKWHKF